MRKIAVILYGPPGSGKSTQADLLAAKLGCIHFNTGQFLEALLHDPSRAHEKVIVRERERFDSGAMNTPSFVLKKVCIAVRKIARAGWGVVFSGSPRTEFEARGLLPLLVKLYEKKHIAVFFLNVRPSISLKRNKHRLLCTVCGEPLLHEYYSGKRSSARRCPRCSGSLYRRTLDSEEAIHVRLHEYRARTAPLLQHMRRQGYQVKMIDASKAPYKMFEAILGQLRVLYGYHTETSRALKRRR